MNQVKGIRDMSSGDSLPAGDSPITDLGDRLIANKVVAVGGLLVVHVANGRGEELCLHLASHGINALASPMAEAAFERVEIDGDADAEVVQTIIDQWEN